MNGLPSYKAKGSFLYWVHLEQILGEDFINLWKKSCHKSQTRRRARTRKEKLRWTNFRWRQCLPPAGHSGPLSTSQTLYYLKARGLVCKLLPILEWASRTCELLSLLAFLVTQQFCEESCERHGGLWQVGGTVGSPGTWILTFNSCSSKYLLCAPILGPESNAESL